MCVKLVIYQERTSYQLVMMTYSMVQYPYLFSAKTKQNKTKQNKTEHNKHPFLFDPTANIYRNQC
jgi:hypothetical protein